MKSLSRHLARRVARLIRWLRRYRDEQEMRAAYKRLCDNQERATYAHVRISLDRLGHLPTRPRP